MPPSARRVEIVERPDAVELKVKVVPGASRTSVVGELGGALKIAVAAPPEGGRLRGASASRR